MNFTIHLFQDLSKKKSKQKVLFCILLGSVIFNTKFSVLDEKKINIAKKKHEKEQITYNEYRKSFEIENWRLENSI